MLSEAHPAEVIEHDRADELTGHDECGERRRPKLPRQEHGGDRVDGAQRPAEPLGAVGYQYDGLGRRTQLTVSGGASTTYGYDLASRLRQIAQGSDLVTLGYDDAGRRALLMLPNGVSTEYQYDLASRLTALIYRNAGGELGSLTYGYDSGGNRVQVGGSLARAALPAAVASATYDVANRQRAFGDTQLTFDDNGNLTSLIGADGTTGLTWDARNRLIKVETPGALASFGYAFGRRSSRTRNGESAQFVYDGLDVIQQFGPGRVTNLLRSLELDEVLAIGSADGVVVPLHDALGSAVAVIGGSGTTTGSYTYEPFGLTSASGQDAAVDAFHFTGRENDSVGELYFYRARYYHPRLHRFISEDPIGFAGGDLNLKPSFARQPFARRWKIRRHVMHGTAESVAPSAGARRWGLPPHLTSPG
jgi:RHS repeat-associated protein